MKVAKCGGEVAKGARELYEKETKKSAISNKNSLNYQYVDEKILECKKYPWLQFSQGTEK